MANRPGVSSRGSCGFEPRRCALPGFFDRIKVSGFLFPCSFFLRCHMPSVKDLNKPAKATQPVAQSPLPAAPVADESHDAIVPSTVAAVEINTIPPAKLAPMTRAVPAFLKTFTAPALAGSQQGSGYVGFASDSSANWPAMQAAKLEVGEPFAHHNGAYLKLADSTLRFWLVACESFKSITDASMTYLYVTRNLKIERVTLKLANGKTKTLDSGPGGIQEHYSAYLFALLPSGEIAPLRADFIGTKSGGVASAVAAVRSAADPNSGWLDMSDSHKITGQFPHPFGRVMCAMRTIPKLSKGNGNTYHRALCHTAPATLDEMGALLRVLGSDLFNETNESAHKAYLDRIKFLDMTADKSRPNVVEELEAQTAAG